MNDKTTNLFQQVLACLQLDDPKQKVQAALALQGDWLAGKLTIEPLAEVIPLPVPGRPENPELVDAR
ncbi:MAG: DUF455 domain-containing protein, partial [Gammaproteobacteria bacterium]|nr:DUF455 domain-containing protein [Gammaproteobacteria bacterium]